MSALVAVQEQLLTVSELIAQLERVAATETPVRPSTLANIRALEKERRTLQEQFSHAAEDASLDVYRYRVLNRYEPTIGGLTKAWLGFQRALSAVYYAQSGKPTSSAKPNTRTKTVNDPAPELQLGFGYAFSGSVGVALTVPNHRHGELFPDDALDRATETIFDLVKSYGNEDKVIAIARRLGKEPVDAVYQWVDSHIQQGFGLNIEWRRNEIKRRDVLAQVEELTLLRDEISRTASETAIQTDGELQAVDTTEKTFRLVGDDGVAYEGTYVDAITEDHKAQLPARYAASIVKVTRFVVIGADTSEETFQLKNLTELF